jgi:hypothetical protein
MQQISHLIWAVDQHFRRVQKPRPVIANRKALLVQMEWSMQQSSEPRARPRTGRVLAIAAALLCATALSQPNLAYAGPHGGGGGGGFHGGGFGGFHGHFAGMHNGFGERHGGFRGGVGFGFFGYPYGWDYSPDYSYYGYSQPYSSQTWYYCSDPTGYYPYVTQCNTGWQAVPAS